MPPPHPKRDNPAPEDLKRQVLVETYRSGGPGGQRKNKTETAVRLTHLSTGVTVTATEQRSQAQNLKAAFERLGEKLRRLRRKRRRRIPTAIPFKATERRIEQKRLVSGRKQSRRRIARDAIRED